MSGVHGAEAAPAAPVFSPVAPADGGLVVGGAEAADLAEPVVAAAVAAADLVVAEPDAAAVAEPGPVELPSVKDAMRSLTGFDEVAIATYFRKDLAEMGATMATRATLFVLKRRDGMADGEAFKFAMHLPLGQVDTMFRAEQPPGQHAAAGGDVDDVLEGFDRPEA